MGLASSQRPRMIAAQAAGCAPIVRAFEQRVAALGALGAGNDGRRRPASAQATGRLPDSSRRVREPGEAVAVNDEALMAACRDMARLEGIFAAPEGGAGLAAIQQLVAQGKIDASESVVLFNTGSGYKYLEAWQAAVQT